MSEPTPENNPEIFKLSRAREAFDSLSDEEQDAQIIESNYAMIQLFGGGCIVSWDDDATPLQYPEDPDRHCRYVGAILDHGRDPELGPWALIDISKHEIQLSSDESVMDGFKEMFNQAYPDPQDAAEAIQTLMNLRKEHPETASYIGLPIGETPRKIYIKDMQACVFSQQTND